MDWESVPVSIEAFKAANRRFATGVTIVTTRNGDAIHGFTVNAFASVTAEPPTVLVCVNRTARAHPIITESGGFCVNILALEQQPLAEKFQGGGHANAAGAIMPKSVRNIPDAADYLRQILQPKGNVNLPFNNMESLFASIEAKNK